MTIASVAATASERPVESTRADARSLLSSPYATAFWAVALSTLVIRFAAGFAFDLNLMESYGVIMARHPSLSYVDHPPLTWWLIGLVTHATGSEAATFVRAPFIVLFLGTSWLLYLTTERLFGARSAFYAAGALTLSPLFGLWVGALALTDGLTIFFALAAIRCLIEIFFDAGRNRSVVWSLWLAAGLFFGLALASKYTAILLLPGLLLFLLSSGPDRRHWFLRPHPYVAISVSLIPLLPVLIWNAEHGWVSFIFQGSRAGFDDGLHPLRALRWIGAQFLYLQPWIFVAAIAGLVRGLKIGPSNGRSWFCVCLAVTPLVFFPSVMLWSSHSLRGYHWAAIGYVTLFPLIGVSLDRLTVESPRSAMCWVTTTALTYVAGLVVLVTHAMTGWVTSTLARVDPAPFTQTDPILVELFDWTNLPKSLEDRHIDPHRTFVAGMRWEACAKAGYALATSYKLLCLAKNNIQFSYIADPADFEGQDAIIVDLSASLNTVKAALGSKFDRIEEEAPIPLTDFGRTIMPLKVFRGVGFHSRRHEEGSSAEHDVTPSVGSSWAGAVQKASVFPSPASSGYKNVTTSRTARNPAPLVLAQRSSEARRRLAAPVPRRIPGERER